MNEKILVILRGLPGSGKTSFAKELTEDLKKKGISTTTSSTDDYWYDDEGNYLFDPYFLRDAHEWNQNRVRQDLKANVSVVIVDNCNMAREHIAPYTSLAKEFGYEVMEIIVGDFDTKSALEYHRRCTHNIPLPTIKRLATTFEA